MVIKQKSFRRINLSLCLFLLFLVVIYSFFPLLVFSAEKQVKITLEVSETEPNDIVSGVVSNVDFSQYNVVVFVRTSGWYIQPFADNRAYLPINGDDGTYETWIRDWRQISVFVVRKGYDVLSAQERNKPFPLSVDGTDVIAMNAYPTLQFSGHEWAIKGGEGLGPGNNDFSTDSESVWVDDQGRLHLKIINRDGKWYCAEVYNMKLLGYGTYSFHLASRIDQLDKNIVGGLFLFQDLNRELDIEFSRWGIEDGPNTQFVVQPYEIKGNLKQFSLSLTGSQSHHTIRWQARTAFFQSLEESNYSPGNDNMGQQWTFSGEAVPEEGDNLRLHLNLWLFKGKEHPPSNSQEVEMIIDAFEWEPLTGNTEKIGLPTIYQLLLSSKH